MFFWRNPIGTQSGPNRAPIFAFLGTAFGQSGSSRDPVGIQSGTNFRIFGTTFGPVGKQPNHPKTRKNTAKMLFFMHLAASRHWCPTGSRHWCPTGSRLDPDWIPTGQKRCPKMQKLVPDGIPTRSRRDPDWIHRSARTHSRTYFSLPRPTLAPIFLFRAPAVHHFPPLLHQNGKSSLKPNGVLQHIQIKRYKDIKIYCYRYRYTQNNTSI